MTTDERNARWKILWKRTHKDFRGTTNGVKTILSWAKYGGGLVSMLTISDDELLARTDHLM